VILNNIRKNRIKYKKTEADMVKSGQAKETSLLKAQVVQIDDSF